MKAGGGSMRDSMEQVRSEFWNWEGAAGWKTARNLGVVVWASWKERVCCSIQQIFVGRTWGDGTVEEEMSTQKSINRDVNKEWENDKSWQCLVGSDRTCSCGRGRRGDGWPLGSSACSLLGFWDEEERLLLLILKSCFQVIPVMCPLPGLEKKYSCQVGSSHASERD